MKQGFQPVGWNPCFFAYKQH